MRIAVLDDYQQHAHEFAPWDSLGAGVQVSFFHEPIEPSALEETLREFEVLVLMRERTAFPRALLERLPRLALLVTTGMGNAAVDIPYLRERGVVVCGTGATSSSSSPGLSGPVEVAWALILALSKRVTVEDRAIRGGEWQLGLPSNLAGRRSASPGSGAWVARWWPPRGSSGWR